MRKLKIIWTTQAKEDLKNIFEFWKKKSLQGAINVRSDILKSPKTILYSEQYQVDDINSKYRRIVVRGNYKVLYKVESKTFFIMGVVGTAQSPEVIKEK
ncbi:MAG: type II toxin-antitoxin system RelE/ParE family toxin [Salinivirgaceae bacterium]|jgi:addiction module RelE/StbE family toxin|nr:type II toxin-antitoxin system RelE/ParE family toxin [Salinivirgaceae bacterium]